MAISTNYIYTYNNDNPAGTFQTGTIGQFNLQYFADELSSVDCPVPVPVTVNYTLTKDASPHVDAAIIPVKNGTNIGNIYGSGSGTFAGTMSGDSMYIGLNHSVLGNPWPAGASANMIITEDGITIYDSGTVTNPSIDVLGSYTFVLVAGKVYQITATSNSASTLYSPVTFNMSNGSSAPLSLGTEVVSFRLIDHTDELFVLFTGQNIQPHNNVGFNWFTDANTGSLTVYNNSLFDLDFILTNVPHGGSYTSATTTILSGATGLFDTLVKTGYSISYTDTPLL